MIWDFRVFTQIYVLQKAGGITRDTNLLGVFAYRISIGENRFDIGAAVAVVMVAITIILTLVYLRAMVEAGGAVSDARERRVDGAGSGPAINAAGALVAARRPVPRVLDGADVVPAQRRGQDADPVVPADATPTLEQLPPGASSATTSGRRCATARMVTATVVVLALSIAFFAAVALSRFRFRGRKAFLVAVIMIQMIPAEALIISLFQVLDGRQLTNRIIGLSLTYLIFVLPFTIWTLRGFVSGVPLELEEAARCRRRQPLRGVRAGDAAARRARPRGDRASSPSSSPGTSSSSPW